MISAAMFFFGIAVICAINGIEPFCCGKRAAIAAIFAYIITTVAVKIVNIVIIEAIAGSLTEKQHRDTDAQKQ